MVPAPSVKKPVAVSGCSWGHGLSFRYDLILRKGVISWAVATKKKRVLFDFDSKATVPLRGLLAIGIILHHFVIVITASVALAAMIKGIRGFFETRDSRLYSKERA